MVTHGVCTPFASLPPPPLSILLIAPQSADQEPPFDDAINLELQLMMPVLYRSATAQTHEHIQGPEAESKIEVNLIEAANIVEILKSMERRGRVSSTDTRSDSATSPRLDPIRLVESLEQVADDTRSDSSSQSQPNHSTEQEVAEIAEPSEPAEEAEVAVPANSEDVDSTSV